MLEVPKGPVYFLPPQYEGGVSKLIKTGCDTQCHGLVDKVVLGRRLDLMISKVFFNPINSVILCYTMHAPVMKPPHSSYCLRKI